MSDPDRPLDNPDQAASTADPAANAEDATNADLKLVETIYGAIQQPGRFEELLRRWDRARGSKTGPPDGSDSRPDSGPDSGPNSGPDIVDTHFTMALDLATERTALGDRAFDTVLEAQRIPSCVIDMDRRLIAGHEDAMLLLSGTPPIMPGQILPDGPFTGAISRILRNSKDSQAQAEALTVGDNGYLLSGTALDGHVLVSVQRTGWKDSMGEMLTSLYGLSPAELKIARKLVDGQNPKEIAESGFRSIETVRSHIKALLQKTGTQRQLDLVRLILTLGEGIPTGPDPALNDNADFTRHVYRLSDGRRLHYLRYGQSGGIPVFYITTSSAPEETAAFRAAMERRGLDVIAPSRPGFGGSDPVRTKSWVDDCIRDYTALSRALDLDRPVLAGNREGGVLAAAMAETLPAARAVILCNTGAPMSSFDDFPDNARRSFEAALKAPRALTFGYRVAKQLFRSGPWGEKRICQFFVEGCKLDETAILRGDVYEALRRNMYFCFEDCAQIVRDIALWVTDWSARLPAKTPAHFVHAARHPFLAQAPIDALSARRENVTSTSIDNAAQLLLYTHPHALADEISRVCGRNRAPD